MLYNLLTRAPLELNVIHDRNPLLVKLSDGSVRNGYNISIINKQHEDTTYALRVDGLEDAAIRVQASSDISAESLAVFANSVGHFRVFITASASAEQLREILFRVHETNRNITAHEESIFVSEAP